MLAFASSLVIAPSFLVTVVALHYTVLPEKRFWTQVAVQLATIYVALACVNYVVQLATVLPAGYYWSFTDQAGTPGPLSVLNETPHSLMWTSTDSRTSFSTCRRCSRPGLSRETVRTELPGECF